MVGGVVRGGGGDRGVTQPRVVSNDSRLSNLMLMSRMLQMAPRRLEG